MKNLSGAVRDVVLRITTIEHFKWQHLLHSDEITTTRGLSSVHQTDVPVAEQASASLRSSTQAPYLLCGNQPLQVTKFCFHIYSTIVSTQQPETK